MILARLALTTTHDARLVRLFPQIPLRHLEIGFCPEVSISDWQEFIKRHARSLELISVRHRRGFADMESASLQKMCDQEGIKLEVYASGKYKFR